MSQGKNPKKCSSNSDKGKKRETGNKINNKMAE